MIGTSNCFKALCRFDTLVLPEQTGISRLLNKITEGTSYRCLSRLKAPTQLKHRILHLPFPYYWILELLSPFSSLTKNFPSLEK